MEGKRGEVAPWEINVLEVGVGGSEKVRFAFVIFSWRRYSPRFSLAPRL